MTSDRKLADFQQWTLTVLGLLSATSDRQVAYLQESGVGTDELLLQFDDVLHVARARLADSSLEQKDFFLLSKVGARVESVNARPDPIWDEVALKEAAEWRDLRIEARVAKEILERSWNSDSGS
ncbi:hypothetical protein GCM10019016_137030 [Streptomyces prasinosporus]|uniref:Uncharacterized protein n=1 Tax=Streptomyces prasinosporus TaxID=68256 RepID=A0ABP6UIL1_9ACTN